MLHYLLAGRLSRRNGEGVGNGARGCEVDDVCRRSPVVGARQDGELQGASFGGFRRQSAAQREQQDQLATFAGCRVETVMPNMRGPGSATRWTFRAGRWTTAWCSLRLNRSLAYLVP